MNGQPMRAPRAAYVPEFAPDEARPVGTDIALSLLDDKWTIYVFKALQAGQNRYGRMLRYLPEITRKMLTQTLRKMERDGLIERIDYGKKPAHVEYLVTPAGQALLDRLCGLCEWSRAFFADVEAARQRFDEAAAQSHTVADGMVLSE